MDAEDAAAVRGLAARVDELAQMCARLTSENAELRDRVSRLSAAPPVAATRRDGPVGPDAARAGRRGKSGSSPSGAVSRRMIGRALSAAAAGAVGATVLADRGVQPAAAADGDTVKAGQTTNAEDATIIQFDGSVDPGAIFLANDSDAILAHVGGAAICGFVGNTIDIGVLGQTSAHNGYGVIGRSEGTEVVTGVFGDVANAGAVGVSGYNTLGTAVAGSSDSTADNATAILGTISSASPGDFSAAVKGENNGTGSAGIGVWGDQQGSGWGVYGTSATGIAVNAESGTGTGAACSGDTGMSAFGTTVGVAALGPTAVRGTGLGSGSRGGTFSGGAAQIKLDPGSLSSHPSNGQRGDLYVDKTGRLWFCKKTGKPATWQQIA